jgi:hypothetical protein
MHAFLLFGRWHEWQALHFLRTSDVKIGKTESIAV